VFKSEIRSHKIFINASQKKVWDILFNIKDYPQWNPFTYRVESDMEIGSNINLFVRMPKRGDRMQSETICYMDEPKQMAWNMYMLSPVLLSARRDQFIDKINEESCSYETVDVFEGLLAPLVMLLFKDDVGLGFNTMANSLKIRAESN